ncbi:MAG: NAD(P)(+) transhydrogenase (Re/Si-specific) subunit alpha, partial [Actinobacteria bacterium]|nr:NAD(P)(+) transhydrogenase (Re/Si-specific) subunit alpha [Actinomycetota bacterium]
MRIFVPAETRTGEKRVALVPDIISKLTRAGLTVSIESGAGVNAGAPDSEYS